eukprot:362965-Chlamydomonas_euryale.AAC.13
MPPTAHGVRAGRCSCAFWMVRCVFDGVRLFLAHAQKAHLRLAVHLAPLERIPVARGAGPALPVPPAVRRYDAAAARWRGTAPAHQCETACCTAHKHTCAAWPAPLLPPGVAVNLAHSHPPCTY